VHLFIRWYCQHFTGWSYDQVANWYINFVGTWISTTEEQCYSLIYIIVLWWLHWHIRCFPAQRQLGRISHLFGASVPSPLLLPLPFIGSTWRAHRDNSNNNTFKAVCRPISSSTLYRLTGRPKGLSVYLLQHLWLLASASVEPLLRTVSWMLLIQRLRGWPGGLVLFGCQWSILHYLVNVRSAFFSHDCTISVASLRHIAVFPWWLAPICLCYTICLCNWTELNWHGWVFDELTSGQAVMHYSRHRLTALMAIVTYVSAINQ